MCAAFRSPSFYFGESVEVVKTEEMEFGGVIATTVLFALRECGSRSTNDFYAVRVAADLLSARTAKHKKIFIFTDGASTDPARLQSSLAYAQEKKIDVVAIAAGVETTDLGETFGRHVTVLNLHSLPTGLHMLYGSAEETTAAVQLPPTETATDEMTSHNRLATTLDEYWTVGGKCPYCSKWFNKIESMNPMTKVLDLDCLVTQKPHADIAREERNKKIETATAHSDSTGRRTTVTITFLIDRTNSTAPYLGALAKAIPCTMKGLREELTIHPDTKHLGH